MRNEKLRALQGYAICMASTLIALALSMAIPHVREHEPFALFFAAVAISAAYGGRGAGLLCCVLSTLLTDYFVIEPAFTWSLGVENVVPLLACVVVATVVSTLTASLKKANDRQLEYEERLRSMASEASLAEERERRRIATGLHDRLGQNLALSKMKVESLRDEIGNAGAASELDRISSLLKQLVNEVRSFTFELSPPILYEFGLGPAIEWLANSMHERYGLACVCQNQNETQRAGQETDVVLFQAVRELLTNVVKHAHATKATVTLIRDEKALRVQVEDDGVGCDGLAATEASVNKNCFGLFNIRERIQFLGGTFAFESLPRQGTRVTLEMPLRG